MFKDARARRAWLLYFLRAEAVLSPLAAPVRRELIADLKAHVQDLLANERLDGDELQRLNAALARVGNPKEFLAPLVAEAVFRAPPRYGDAGMAMRTLSLYAARGTSYFLRALGLVLAAAAGACVMLASLNSILRPASAGLFLVGEDEYSLRLFGLGKTSGLQLLEPWMAALLIVLGLAVVVWSFRSARRMLMELVAETA
jgi:hypothetical protein